MITGDHPSTAARIAADIGLEHADKIMTGEDIDAAIDDENFNERILNTGVFARVSPENKLQLVQALKEEGEVVAMTSDGVNDAPALNGADIGIAMGIRGTEVAKEASDMILTDDRFGTIVDAVRIGRIIFESIKKYVSFLFSCNMVGILSILLTIAFMLPMPIQPLHILYLNKLIDIGPAIVLAYEPAESDVMEKAPRKPEEGLVNRTFITRIILSGLVIGLGAFLVFYGSYQVLGFELDHAQTMTFTYMAVAQLAHIFNVRINDGFGLNQSLFKNRILLMMIALSLILQLIAVYIPFMNNVLNTVPLALFEWGIILIAVVIVTLAVYFLKRLFVHQVEV